MLKTFLRSGFLTSAIFLAACGSSEIDSALSVSKESTATQSAETPKASQVSENSEINFYDPDIYSRMVGLYVFGEGVETFKPCGETKNYWVFTANEDMWATLKEKHDSLTTEPYEGVYIELFGWLGPKLHPIVGGEYASKSDGHIVIDDFVIIRKSLSSDCKG